MQVSTKFTIAIHVIAAIEYFKEEHATSKLLADSIGTNPVIIRNIMSDLKKAGLIDSRRGTRGIKITKPLQEITFYDIYKAVETNNEHLFNFHEHPNPECPVGRNIHLALDEKLATEQKMFEDDLKKYTMADVVKDIHYYADQSSTKKMYSDQS